MLGSRICYIIMEEFITVLFSDRKEVQRYAALSVLDLSKLFESDGKLLDVIYCMSLVNYIQQILDEIFMVQQGYIV